MSTSLNLIRFVKAVDHGDAALVSRHTFQAAPSVENAKHERVGFRSVKRKFEDQSKSATAERARDASTDPEQLVLCKLYRLGHLIRQGTIPGANALEKFYIAVVKARMKIVCKIDCTSAGFSCKITLDGICVAKGSATSHNAARGRAIEAALERLKQPYYEIMTADGESRLFVETDKAKEKAALVSKQRLNNIRLNFPNFVVVQRWWDTCALSTLNSSAHLNKVKCSIKGHEGGASAFLNGIEIGRGTGEKGKVARLEAAKDALRLLQMVRPTIRIKTMVCGEELTKKMVGDSTVTTLVNCKSAAVAMPANHSSPSYGKISDDNVGYKLLKLMGWSGGGIGKDECGILDPIVPKEVVRRAGLGFQGNCAKGRPEVLEDTVLDVTFKSKIRKVVQDFAKTKVLKDLVFSPEFGTGETLYIQGFAGWLGLTTIPRSGPGGRYLTLRHKFSAQELLQMLLEVGSTEKYEVIPPSSNIHL